MAAVERGLHVMVTKPAVKTLEHHLALDKAARAKGVRLQFVACPAPGNICCRSCTALSVIPQVLVMVEVHKRFDPIYVDARDRIPSLGPFSYFYAHMSQPKHQLDTFRAWAGKSSDISYYLNSHHIDFHEWTQQRAGHVGMASRPVRGGWPAAPACLREPARPPHVMPTYPEDGFEAPSSLWDYISP